MKAAIVTSAGSPPTFEDFQTPVAQDGLELIAVVASALSNLTKARAAGQHYSADHQYPVVVGVDGVGLTRDGRRVYFVMPEAPFGAMAEQTLVNPQHIVPIPADLDSIAAAALANPGMSCFAALEYRGQFQAGETVLINGATGTSGNVAVQVARHLGARKIIATGRNAMELEALREVGADVVIPFAFGAGIPQGTDAFEDALETEFSSGIDVVIDYLWGTSARTVIVAIARAAPEGHPVRFIQVGGASREPVELPDAALRSSAIQIMGSGFRSVPFPKLLGAVNRTFALAAEGGLNVAVKTAPLSMVADTWSSAGKPRLVYTIF